MALAARLRLSLHSSGLPASSSGRRLGSIPRAFKTEGLQAGTRDLILKEGASRRQSAHRVLEPRALAHQARACALQAGGGQLGRAGGQRQPRAGRRVLTLGLHSHPARRGRGEAGSEARRPQAVVCLPLNGPFREKELT